MNKDITERYRFIEQVIGWEGEINSTHISDKFSLTRQAASTALKQYREYAPHYLEYNASNKAYLPTQSFNDYFSKSEYLKMLPSLHLGHFAWEMAENLLFGITILFLSSFLFLNGVIYCKLQYKFQLAYQ